MIRHLFLYLIGSCLAIAALGQDCQKSLDDARRAYFNGDFQEVERLIVHCLDNGFNKEDKEEALKLLTTVKLITNDDDEADRYMLELLSVNPQHKVRTTDITEFQQLFNSYKVTSRFSIGIIAGVTLSDYYIMKYQSISSLTSEPDDYDEQPGFSLGVSGDIRLINSLYMVTGLTYQTNRYKQSEIQLDNLRASNEETSHYLSVPLQLRYMIDRYRFKPFIGGGITLNYLVSSSADLDVLPTEPSLVNPGNAFFVQDYSLTFQRERLINHWTIHAGIRQNLGKYAVDLNASYSFGLKNLVKVEERYANDELITTYNYVPDDFKMDYMSLTIGVSRTVLKPEKR